MANERVVSKPVPCSSLLKDEYMTNTRWGILYCPKHGATGAKKRWGKIESCLRDNGIDFDCVQSERQEGGGRRVTLFVVKG